MWIAIEEAIRLASRYLRETTFVSAILHQNTPGLRTSVRSVDRGRSNTGVSPSVSVRPKSIVSTDGSK